MTAALNVWEKEEDVKSVMAVRTFLYCFSSVAIH